MRHRRAKDIKGMPVLDARREKIGTVSDLYVDEQTDAPRWILVDTGLLSAEVLVPFREVTQRDGAVVVPFAKSHVKAAPLLGMSEELDEDQERALNEHYGLEGRAA